jgi:hypothetical protein
MEGIMKGKEYSAEQFVSKLRQAEVRLSRGAGQQCSRVTNHFDQAPRLSSSCLRDDPFL